MIFLTLVIGVLSYFVWRQAKELKQLKKDLQIYHTEKVLYIEKLAQRTRQELLQVTEKVLSEEKIKEVDERIKELMAEFEEEIKDPLSEIYDKKWFK
jgi:hypothetical protein